MRGLEWAGVTLALFLLSGAVVQLMMEAPDGMLDVAERAKLRLLMLPVYAITLTLLARRPDQLLLAAGRNLPMLALVALPFFSVLWSISPSVTLRRSVGLALTMALAYVIAMRFTPRQQILLLGSLLGAATILSLVAGLLLPGPTHMPETGGLRGVFLDKNVLGWVACYTVAIGLAALRDPLRRMRRFGWVLVLSGWVAVLLSGSATSLLGTVVAVVLAHVLEPVARARGLRKLALQLLLLIGTILALAALATMLVPLLEALGKDATLTGRVPLWKMVDAAIAERPLLGYGYGAFWTEASPNAWAIWSEVGWQAPHAHNGFRDLLLSFGVLGTALFAFVVLRAFRHGLALVAEAPGGGWILCLLLLGVSLSLNLAETTLVVQNDLTWVMAATAILSLSFRHASLERPLPAYLRTQLAAA